MNMGESSFLIINSDIFLSGLGEVYFVVASVAVKKLLRQTSKRGAYKVYTNKYHHSIGQYASCHEVAASVITWKKIYPNLNGSTMRGFKKLYEAKLKEASHRIVSPKKKLANKMRERPTLLAPKLDTFVQKFLRATRYKGGVVNTETALANAKALVKRYSLLEKENLVLGAPWVKRSILPYGFCSAPKDYRKSTNSRRSAKRSQIEISPPNGQLCGEVPDSTIANYQLRSDTTEIRPDFFKYNGKERGKKCSNIWNR